MKLTRIHSGMAGNSMIIGLLVLVLIAGIVVYFYSDPTRAKIDEQINQFRNWTPENIAENPTGYLKFCRTKCEDTLQSLKAREIDVEQKKAQLIAKREESNRKVAAGEKALGALKTAYRTADAAGAWPITWNGNSYDQDKAKRQIMMLHKQTQSESRIRDKIADGLEKLDRQRGKIDEVRATCKEKLTEIESNLSLLEVQELTDDLTDELVNMRGVLESAIVSAGESGDGYVDLDQLTADEDSQVDDSEFDAIMGN